MSDERKSDVLQMAAPVAVLTVICLVIVALLTGTYQFTKPYIEAAEQEQANEARRAVFSGETTFTPYEMNPLPDGIVEIHTAEGKGYAVKAQATGYDGSVPVTVMVGIKTDGTVAGVTIISHGETPGLGGNIERESFTGQFIGKNADSAGEAEIIAGATRSSKAVAEAVRNAAETVRMITGEGGGEENGEDEPIGENE